MLETLGSTVIMLIGVTAAWLMRRHLRWAWRLLLLNQGIWLIYGTLTAQWGFVIGAILYGSGILNNLTGYADVLRRWVGLPPAEQPSDAATRATIDLLAACEAYVATMALTDPGDFLRALDPLDKQIRAAVAKARGA